VLCLGLLLAGAVCAAAAQPGWRRLELSQRGAGGTVLTVRGIAFVHSAIALELTLSNRLAESIQLNGRGDTLLRDDLGNEYRLQAPPVQPTLPFGPGMGRAELRFNGPLSPAASALTLMTNATAGPRDRLRPRFEVPGIPVRQDASAATAEQRDLAVVWSVGRQLGLEDERRPSGVDVDVRRVRLETGQVVVNLSAANHSESAVQLNGRGDMLVRDDHGNRFRLILPDFDPKLMVHPGSVLSLELTFVGHIDPGARSVTLHINDAGPSAAAAAAHPRIVIRDIPLRR
jgi:hypothetical protein